MEQRKRAHAIMTVIEVKRRTEMLKKKRKIARKKYAPEAIDLTM